MYSKDHILILEGVLSPEFCNEVIEKFKTDAHVADDPQPDYSKRRYLNLSEQNSWLTQLSTLLDCSNDVAEKFFHSREDLMDVSVPDWVDDGFIMSCYSPGDDLVLHVDGQSCDHPYNGLRLATLVLFLNDCEGGELYFPVQDRTIKPKQGRAVIFPPGYTHPHEVKTTNSSRFIIQTWLTDPSLEVIER